MAVTKRLTEGNIYARFVLFALPLILSSLLSQAYSTVDGIIAGKFVSEHALGAIGATSSFESLLNALFHGFAAGFAIYISHLFGKGNVRDIKRDVVGTVSFVATVSLLLSVLVITLRGPILDFLNVDPVLYRDAEIYFMIYAAGYAVLYVNMCLVETLHALGISSFSLYVSLLSAVLNIGGNLFAVLVLDLGVAGLAISTVFSSAMATVIYLVLLRRAFREMGAAASCRFSLAGVRHSMKYTLPTALQKMAFLGIAFLIAPSINALGADATTGYSIANRMYALATIGLWAMSSSLGCYTGQCAGEGDTQKLRRGLRVGFLLNAATLLPFVLTIIGFAEPSISIFFPDEHGSAAFGYAVRYATVFLPFVYVQLVGHVFHTYMRSLGRVPTVLAITIVGSTVRLVATLLLIPLLHLDGAYVGQIISWAVDAALSFVLYVFLYRTDRQLSRIVGGA
ncbi:MAG: hypothetical protein IJY16_01320 [Clostridia bacterium]|nr:hypothetical protein [Clostridia bacterium]